MHFMFMNDLKKAMENEGLLNRMTSITQNFIHLDGRK